MPYHIDKISRHFTKKEAVCKCGCGYVRINDLLVHKLERLRAMLGHKPITVLSWCRCEAHNKKVGGVATSNHMTGEAVDITVPGVMLEDIAAMAQAAGFDFIKIYQDQKFVHVDVRGYK